MNSLELIKNIFEEPNLTKLNLKIRETGDLLKSDVITKQNVIKGINSLFEYIKICDDESTIENILNTALSIMESHNIYAGFNLDILLHSLDKLNFECISYVLSFLGFSGEQKYIKIIKSFLEVKELREDAEDALREIDYQLAKK